MTIVHYGAYIYWGMFGRGSDRRRDVFSTLALLTVLLLSQRATRSTFPSPVCHPFYQRNFNLNKYPLKLGAQCFKIHITQPSKTSGDKYQTSPYQTSVEKLKPRKLWVHITKYQHCIETNKSFWEPHSD